MKNIFIHPGENRLRAGWRVTFHMVLTVGLVFGLLATGIIDDLPLSLAWMEFSFMIIAVLVTAISRRYFDQRKFTDLGLTLRQGAWWLDLAVGVGLGGLAAGGLVLIFYLLGWVRIEAFFSTFQPGLPILAGVAVDLFTFASVGVMEELIRAYQLVNLSEGLTGPQGKRWRFAWLGGALGASLFSMLMHLNQQGPSFWIYTFLNSLIYCAMMLLTGRIALSLGLHMAWDFFITTVVSLGGAGPGFNAAVLFSAPLTPAGKQPENWALFSLIGLVLKLFSLSLVYLYTRRRTGQKGSHPVLQEPDGSLVVS
jgi:hypothetical protein